MTFEIWFPFAALAIAGLGVLYFRNESRKIDRMRQEDEPAE
jgi:hypothetical protein